MVRLLVFCLLLSSNLCRAQNANLPSVVILRQGPPPTDRHDARFGSAVLLDRNANLLRSIDGLGISQSISSQCKVQINPSNGQVIVAENMRNRVSLFDANGKLEKQIPLPNIGGVALGGDNKTLACLAVENLNDVQTIFVDVQSDQQIRRLNLGGVALVKDIPGPLFWSIGKQLSAFGPDGEVAIRRPLSRLPAEAEHPTVINSRNWCGTGIAIEPNENSWMRAIWVIEREHPDVPGSKNRLFAVDKDGRTQILVELNDLDPRSLTHATYRTNLSRILVVDGGTGDLVSFNSDGELMGREKLGVNLVCSGKKDGLWVVSSTSAKRLDPSNLSVLSEFEFETESLPIGLTVR